MYVFNSVRTPVGLWVNKDGEGTNLGKVNDAFIIKIRALKSAIKDNRQSKYSYQRILISIRTNSEINKH